jgi:hypothetical protein
MKLKQSRWMSRSGDFTGTQLRTPKGKVVKVELDRSSQLWLAHINRVKQKEQSDG